MTRPEGRHAIGRLTWGGVAVVWVVGVRVMASRVTEGRVAGARAVSVGGQGEGQLGMWEVRGRKVT
ncbi:hypothetical protein ADK76_15565 [Streptomyces griseoflavus]|nr:hypothetical protein ADK76_15565 [Streptomyces griseoflavus]